MIGDTCQAAFADAGFFALGSAYTASSDDHVWIETLTYRDATRTKSIRYVSSEYESWELRDLDSAILAIATHDTTPRRLIPKDLL